MSDSKKNSTTPLQQRSPIRLVRNEDVEMKKDISDFKTKKPNSLVMQLQLLADSIDAQVKEILELN